MAESSPGDYSNNGSSADASHSQPSSLAMREDGVNIDHPLAEPYQFING